jgi:predicted MPP superfamily phosphohydrolase
LLVVGCAWRFRSRTYATFRCVTLGLQVLFASALFARFHAVWPLFVYGHAAVFAQSLALIRPRMHGLAYRALVSIPGAFFGAGTLLALPWVLLSAFGIQLPGVWLPYAVALLGVIQSLRSAEEQVQLVVADGLSVPELKRHSVTPPVAGGARRPLSIVQITDPHLGPFMSVARLRTICERAVERNPDLVLLTGDFLTMESQSDPELLAASLAPLQALEGRCFACFGNHDHEAPDTVRSALQRAGVTLLVDDSRELETPAGPVQIVGMDFVWKGRQAHLARVSTEHPRKPGYLRIVLLHDPAAFRHLPEGEADLALSGHTHGGQVGLVSLGLKWTLLRVFMNAPDHGFWARGSDRLYVHRGTGHYGFPLRLGVPGEESMLLVHAGSGYAP